MGRDTKIAFVGPSAGGYPVVEIVWNGYASSRTAFPDTDLGWETAKTLGSDVNKTYQRGWDDAMAAVRELLGVKEPS
jgi:hypothetical protein